MQIVFLTQSDYHEALRRNGTFGWCEKKSRAHGGNPQRHREARNYNFNFLKLVFPHFDLMNASRPALSLSWCVSGIP